MDVLPYIFIAIVGLVSGMLSGISGGGGGMLMIPAYIFAGLPPQVAVATGKMSGLGSAFGGILAFTKTGHIRKDILRVMIPIAVVVGIATPFVFATIESGTFQLILGIILILLVPTLFIKKKVHSNKNTSKARRIARYPAYTGVLSIQAVFGSGSGTLALFVMTLLFGTTKLEANATKRTVTAVLTSITFIALLIGGYVAILYGLVGMVSMLLGTHYGSRLALKGSDKFVKIAMATIILISGLALVLTAM